MKKGLIFAVHLIINTTLKLTIMNSIIETVNNKKRYSLITYTFMGSTFIALCRRANLIKTLSELDTDQRRQIESITLGATYKEYKALKLSTL